MNILVPIDFSSNSKNALVYALNLAKEIEAKLFLLHAYRLLSPYVRPIQGNGYTIKEELDQESKMKFYDLEQEILNDTTVEYEIMIEIGFAANIIESVVKQQRIDLVIMGNKGNGTMHHIFGSTTLDVIRKVHCPVLVVPEEAQYRTIKQIIIASDYNDIKNPGIFSVINILEENFNSDLHLVNFNSNNKITESEGELGELKFDKYFPKRNLQYHFQSTTDVETGLNQFVEDLNSDILVLIPRDRDFFQKIFKRSITKHMILHSSIPILALHE